MSNFTEALHPRDAGKFAVKDGSAPDAVLRAPRATADSLSDLLNLNDFDRAWLTAELANGGSVRTAVSCELADVTEEDDDGSSEWVGETPVGDLYIRVFRNGGDLGELRLPGDWPDDEFDPDGRGRNGEEDVNGRDYSDSIDFAIATMATDAGFTLENCGIGDGSAERTFIRAFDLSL